MIEDPGLVERLHASGAAFTSEIIEETSPLATLLLSWLLPIGVFVLLGQFMSKKLMDKAGGGAGSMMFRVERLFFHSASLSAVFFDELDIVAHKLHSLRRARAESRAGVEGVFHDCEVYVHPRFGKELIHML